MTARMNEFFVYEHWRPDTGVCFYVGKGKGDRARSMRRKGRHRYVTNKLAGLGLVPEVRMIAEGLSEQDAFQLERELIAKHGRQDRGLGNLVNSTDGGDGRAGWKASPETRAKIAAKLMGNTNFAGKVCSPEHREKIAAAQRGRVMSDEQRAKVSAAKKGCKGTFAGKNHSLESRAKMAASHAGSKKSEETRRKMSESHKARAALLKVA